MQTVSKIFDLTSEDKSVVQMQKPTTSYCEISQMEREQAITEKATAQNVSNKLTDNRSQNRPSGSKDFYGPKVDEKENTGRRRLCRT